MHKIIFSVEPQIEIENHKPKYYFGDVVTCTARGNPSSHNVEWLDDNGMPAKYTLSTGLAHSMSAILTISPGMEGNHSYTCNAFYDINGEDTVLSETIHFVVVGRYPSICTLLWVWLPKYVSYMGSSGGNQTRNSIQSITFLAFHKLILNILRDPLEFHGKIIYLLSHLQAYYLRQNWSFFKCHAKSNW